MRSRFGGLPGGAVGEVGDPALVTTGASVLGGGVWKAVGTTLPQVYSLILSIAAARFLGADGLGRQSFIAFIALSATSLLSAGVPLALMRYVGETIGRGAPGAARSLLVWAWRLELLGASVGGVALAAAAFAGAEPRGAWFFAAVVCSLGTLHAVPSALLVGLQRWRDATIAGLVTGAVGAAATIGVLAAGGGITGMFAVEAVASVFTLSWTSLLARRAVMRVATRPTFAGDLRRAARRYATLASVTAVLDLIVWKRSEFFFLAQYSTDQQIAFYSVSFAMVTTLVRLPGRVATVVSPAIANLFGAGQIERIRSGFSRALRLLLLVSVPLVAAAAALGPRTLTVVWGEEFEAAASVLLVMVAASIVAPVADLGFSLLVGLGRARAQVLFNAVAAGVDVGLAFLLVPRYDALGAALANAGAQLVAVLPLVVYARSIVGRIDLRGRSLLAVATAAGAAGLAGLAGVSIVDGAGGLALGAAAAIGVFVTVASVVKILAAEDADWLEDAAGRRLGGLVGAACRMWGRRSAAAEAGRL